MKANFRNTAVRLYRRGLKFSFHVLCDPPKTTSSGSLSNKDHGLHFIFLLQLEKCITSKQNTDFLLLYKANFR